MTNYSEFKFRHMKELAAIVCVSQNGIIGNNGAMPWQLKGDLKYFKETTNNSCVIMGSKTYKSIGKPLPNRHNIVITRSRERWSTYGIDIVNSLEEALKLADSCGYIKSFIVGGATIYEQSFKMIDKLYLTRILRDYEGDTKFPYFKDINQYFNLESKSDIKSEDGIDYIFEIYNKK